MCLSLPALRSSKTLLILTFAYLLLSGSVYAIVPPNDSCTGSLRIIIPNNGYGLGVFVGANTDMTDATVEPGEQFASAIFVAGLDKKSAWYKFTLPTTRGVKVTLTQPGVQIAAGDAGFTIYKTNTCLPGLTSISSKFTPNPLFGDSYHPCVEAGEYLVQVSSKAGANGQVFIRIELTEPSPAQYDKPAGAQQFGTVSTNKKTSIDFNVDCQSIDDSTENCLPNGSFKDFTKSTWHIVTTPGYFDYFAVLLAEVYPTTSVGPNYLVGYRLYKGDASSTPLNLLTEVAACDSFVTNGYYSANKIYRCGELDSNTTYSIQLLYHKDFVKTMRLAVMWEGGRPTTAPEPVSSIVAPNKMGVLAADNLYGVNNTSLDYLACNSHHNLHSCPNSLPVNGLTQNGYKYNLSTFFSFTLANTSTIRFNYQSASCYPYLMARLFKQSLTTDCNDLDTLNIYSTITDNITLNCMEAGDYVLQVTGHDSLISNNNYYYYGNLATAIDNDLCLAGQLGKKISISINVKTEVATNRFSLSSTGKFDSLNVNSFGVMQPLQAYTNYIAQPDTFGCANTVFADSSICLSPYNTLLTKATYRQFEIADSFMLRIGARSTWQTKLFMGDANALATAQNLFNYPDVISGLVPYSNCLSYSGDQFACVTPGTYSLVQTDNRIGQAATIEFTPWATKRAYATAATAQDMGDLWSYVPPNTYYRSGSDTFTCRDNPDTIGGLAPCTNGYGYPSNKLIYRQFYLNQPTVLTITNYNYQGNNYYGYGKFTLFTGKATDGISTLQPVGGQWTCFTTAATATQCDALPAGWYTVVAYGAGPNFDNPLAALPANSQASDVGLPNFFFVNLSPYCQGPQFNRPYKASIDTITNQPYQIEWGPQTGHTAAYPVTHKKYTLITEHFNCTQDTTFIKLNMTACNSIGTKVAFYVFTTTQESYVQIDGVDEGLWSALYAFDVRTGDSVKLKTDAPLQACTNKKASIEFCKLQPGTYTLVFFAPTSYACNAIAPTIYIDQVGYSRFDHAAKAYDFGVLVPDSVWRDRKTGDVNPLDAGRAPSNDFFYCTTGARPNDPDQMSCMTLYNPVIYSAGNNVVLHPDNTTAPNYNTIDRRNLWYTFAINQPGWVRVKVENKTPGKTHQYPFAVYKTDESGSLSFNQLVTAGKVDSTQTLGLTEIAKNWIYYSYYCEGTQYVSFYVDPCTFTPSRYYVIVENRNPYGYNDVHFMNPNSQAEVSVLLDSTTAIFPKFDHFSQANDMGLLNNGIKQGAMDNFTCATKDAADPIYGYTSCQKTLWYKFTTTVTGQIRYAAFFKNTNEWYYDNIQLFKQIRPNDSSSTGLLHLPYTTNYANNGYWAQRCITPGTYYIILPGCNALNEYVYPQIEIIPEAGDFCSSPGIAQINGPGPVSTTLIPDCHTIGTDYGEFGPTLTCPAGAPTIDYKTSWFRMDVAGTDTLDVTAYLVENTNASSTQIKYRLMTGDCGAMQEQSCVQDALTQNTYQCLLPGQQYYVQVFTPATLNGYNVTGTLELKLSAIKHVDTCAPVNTCLASANFIAAFNCTTDRGVKFNNYSTYGTAISYKWDFGYGGQTSTALSPTFIYPATAAAQTYNVKLVTTNNGCGKSDSVTIPVTIPGRPLVNFGSDLIRCNGTPVTLSATSFTGAGYSWQDGSTNSTFIASSAGQNTYFVEVTYNGCISRDTINILINPVLKKPLENLVVCNGDSVLLNANRGYGETYTWNTGASTASIYARTPGTYWVNIRYSTCTIRDSFIVSSVANARPLGRDTLVCLTSGPLIADATVTGAVSYGWQNGSTSPTFSITAPGLYWVSINFGACAVRDTLNVSGYPAAIIANTTGATCAGNTYLLPWGQPVSAAGIYRDTIRYSSGCDSLIRRVTVTVNAKPSMGADKSIAICFGQTANLTNQYTTTGLTSSWTLNGAAVTTAAAVDVAGVYRLVVSNSSGCLDTALVTLTVNAKPDLGADKDTSVCTGVSIDLTSQFLSGGLVTNWTKNGVIVSNPANVTTGGTYQLIVTNASGCTDTAAFTLTLYPKPALGVDKTTNICFGTTADLTAMYTTAGLTGNWTTGGVTVVSPTAADLAGVYQLIAINTDGCADTATIGLTINPKPDLGADKAAAICSENSFDLTGQFITTGLTSSWSLNNTAVTTPSAATTAGIYELIVTNNFGCKDTSLFTLTVNTKPAIGLDKVISICPGFTTDLTTQFTTTGLTTNWTTGAAPVVTPSAVGAAGIYQLIAINTDGCSDTALATVSIDAKPALGPDKTAAICNGNSFDLTTQFATSGTGIDWSVNSLLVTNPGSVNVAGNYRLIETNTFGCRDTALVALTVNTKPAVGIDKSIAICQGNAADLTAQFNTIALTANWTTAGVVVPNPAAVFSAGIYQLIVNNSFGCLDTALLTVTVHPKPNLGADKVLATCFGTPLDLTTLYNTTGLTTAWTLNGTVVANPSSITSPGIYQLIVSNSFGCLDTALVTNTIASKPNLGNDQSFVICERIIFDLGNQFVSTGLASSWTIGGITVPNPAAVTQTGTYQLIVSSNLGCKDTALLSLTVNPSPALGNDKPYSFCAGSSGDLTTLYNTTNLSSSWSINGAAVASPAAITAAGNYQLIVVNSFGCADTALVTVSINPLPTLTVADPLPVCTPSTINLTAASITAGSSANLILSYWLNAAATLAFPTAANATTGLYFIKATDINGCVQTAAVNALVYPDPIVYAGPDTSICDQSVALLHGTASAPAPATLSYLWSPAASLATPDTILTTANPTGTTLFSLSATANYGVCSITVSDSILVTMQPPVQGFAGNDTNAVIGAPHQLFATGGVSYLWSPSAVLNNPFLQNPLATLFQDTRFTVIVKDIEGCADTSSVFIKAYEGVTYYVPNAFSPNGDGNNDIFRPIPVGIVSTSFFMIYNRYGQLMFETNKWMDGWDGTFKGKPQPVANYIWIIKGKGKNGRVIEMKGNVVLVR